MSAQHHSEQMSTLREMLLLKAQQGNGGGVADKILEAAMPVLIERVVGGIGEERAKPSNVEQAGDFVGTLGPMIQPWIVARAKMDAHAVGVELTDKDLGFEQEGDEDGKSSAVADK